MQEKLNCRKQIISSLLFKQPRGCVDTIKHQGVWFRPGVKEIRRFLHICLVAFNEGFYIAEYTWTSTQLYILQFIHDRLAMFWLIMRQFCYSHTMFNSTLTTQPPLTVNVWHGNQADTFTSGIWLLYFAQAWRRTNGQTDERTDNVMSNLW